jgi:uncharacterized protein (TIGR03086 family)
MSADLPAPVVVLARALDQAEAMLGRVRSEHLSRPTPCRDWSVGRLVSHLVADPGNFATTMKGGQPDWSAEPEPVDDPRHAFRAAADELLGCWQGQDGSAAAGADWQTAEIAVHTWDLARALDRPTADLDAEAAERGLAFMRANLTADNRGQAFGPERAAPPGASAPDRLAAFAGREV